MGVLAFPYWNKDNNPIQTFNSSIVSSAHIFGASQRKYYPSTTYPVGTYSAPTQGSIGTSQDSMYGNRYYYQGMLRWDTSETAPEGSVIIKATLRIYVIYCSGAGAKLNVEYANFGAALDATDFSTSWTTGNSAGQFDLPFVPNGGNTWFDLELSNPNGNINRAGFTDFKLGSNVAAQWNGTFLNWSCQFVGYNHPTLSAYSPQLILEYTTA